MIQRIQSLFLLLTALLTIIFLRLTFFKFFNTSGTDIIMNFKGIFQVSDTGESVLVQNQLPLSAILLIIPILSLIIIFLFKNRRIQLKLTLIVIALASILILYLAISALLIVKRYEVQLLPAFPVIVPPLVLLFSIFAYRGIKKDDAVVKSYDRLR